MVSKKIDQMYEDSAREMEQSISSLKAPKKKEKLFRNYRNCRKANILDRIGMVTMLVAFAMIIMAVVLAFAHTGYLAGMLLFFGTYIGIVGYEITAHATKVYIRETLHRKTA